MERVDDLERVVVTSQDAIVTVNDLVSGREYNFTVYPIGLDGKRSGEGSERFLARNGWSK